MTTTQTTCDGNHDNPRYTYICVACLEKERALLNTMFEALETVHKAAKEDRDLHDGRTLHSLGCDRSLELIEDTARAAVEAAR